jgi:hypothetical protein
MSDMSWSSGVVYEELQDPEETALDIEFILSDILATITSG